MFVVMVTVRTFLVMSLQTVLLALSSKVGFTVDETKVSPNLLKRIGELQTMRGFLDQTGVEVSKLARTCRESQRLVLIPGLIGLFVVLLGVTGTPLILPGVLCLGLSGVLYYTGARPVQLSLARKKRELESITTAFNGAVDRTSKDVAKELSKPTGWPAKTE